MAEQEQVLKTTCNRYGDFVRIGSARLPLEHLLEYGVTTVPTDKEDDDEKVPALVYFTYNRECDLSRNKHSLTFETEEEANLAAEELDNIFSGLDDSGRF